jgi:hypothetical protein
MLVRPTPINTISVLGVDPSLRNWGLAKGVYDLSRLTLVIETLSVVTPQITTTKQVRQNSKDLHSASQLAQATALASQGVQGIFIEVPHGSQSARAMASYGICVGVLGALRAMGVIFFEVSATEVKLNGAGNKNPTKQQMIDWAIHKHPEAPWPRYKRQGQWIVNAGAAEHMADAIAAIYAGIASNTFQQLLPLLNITKEHSGNSTETI